MNVVEDLERRMEVKERWTQDNAKYQDAEQHTRNRKFTHAVDELEGLVVQRIFELSKANLAGTGMLVASDS